MDAFKGIFNDAGDLFDSIKDKIATPNSEKANSDSGSRDASSVAKKISFENMGHDLDEEMPGGIPPQIVLDVVVIGAGLAGLTTAYRLQQNDEDLRIRVLEATDFPSRLGYHDGGPSQPGQGQVPWPQQSNSDFIVMEQNN